MEAGDRRKIEIEFDARGCLENIQFSVNQADLNAYESDDFQNAGKHVGISLATDVDGHLPELHESMESAQTQTSKRYNLRKSLAWDAAFFTSEGVLDSEELSSMITGADDTERKWLPGIQEAVTDSIESISTLESDDLNLETLEEDLFVDIRASIKRSSKKMSNLTISSNKKPGVEIESAPNLSLEKVGIASQNKNAKPGPMKTSDLQKRSLPKPHVGKQGSMKAVEDSGHTQMNSIARIGEKIQRITNKPKTIGNSISTTRTAKRESIGTNFGKSEQGISIARAATRSRGTQPADGPTGALTRPAVSSKPYLLGSSTNGRMQPARPSSSGDSSSMPSGTHAKSQLMMPRRNTCKSYSEGACPSGFTPKTPRAPQRNKATSSTLSAYVMSNKNSSSASPASSVSEWSSVSSSSSSSMTHTRFNNSKTTLDTSSFGSIAGDIDLLHQSNCLAEQTADKHKNQGVTLPGSNSKASSNDVTLASMKPSGLRKPSPKIGFFDEVKSSPHINQLSQLAIRAVFPKKGIALGSPIQSSNSILKCAKAPHARLATSFSTTKQDSPQLASAQSSQEKNPSDPFDLTGVKTSPSLSLEIEGNANGERCQKPGNGYSEDGEKVIDRTRNRLANQDCLKYNSHPHYSADEKENALDKIQAPRLTTQNRNSYQDDHGQKDELLSDTSEFTFPLLVTNASESAAANVSPFENDCFSNVWIDASKEVAHQ